MHVIQNIYVTHQVVDYSFHFLIFLTEVVIGVVTVALDIFSVTVEYVAASGNDSSMLTSALSFHYDLYCFEYISRLKGCMRPLKCLQSYIASN